MSTPTLRRNVLASLALAIPMLGAASAPAGAATAIGQTFVPSLSCGGNTFIQRASPAGQYVVPERGVITSWSHIAAQTDVVTSARLKVGRPGGNESFAIVGQSAEETIAPGQLNTFRNSRVPVLAGDVIGIWPKNGGACAATPGDGYGVSFTSSGPDDAPVGSTPDFISQPGIQVDVAAILEPDSDADGYGDETQDDCPTDPSTHGACPEADEAAPETTITKAPKRKLTSPRGRVAVTVSFSSSEESSTFVCSLDGNAPDQCSSPFVVKVGEGRHRIGIVASDAAGNADHTPAAAAFRVNRRRRADS
jgi:hypothetical protein